MKISSMPDEVTVFPEWIERLTNHSIFHKNSVFEKKNEFLEK